MATTTDLLRFVPSDATHTLVEKRTHRGQDVYAVLAVVPGGSSPVLNAYSDPFLACRVADDVDAYIAERVR